MKRNGIGYRTFGATAALISAVLLLGCDLDSAGNIINSIDPCSLLGRNDVIYLADLSVLSEQCGVEAVEHIEDTGPEEEEEAGGGHVH